MECRPALTQAVDSSLASGREMGHKWVLTVMPKLGRNRSCTGTPRNKTYQGAPDRKSRSWTKNTSSQSTRLTQISAGGLSLSKRQSPAQQSAFCAAQPYPARAGWKKKKKLVSFTCNLTMASRPKVDRALLDSRSAQSPISQRG